MAVAKQPDKPAGKPADRQAAVEAGARPMPPRPTEERALHGPRPLGALIPGVTRPAYRRRAPATAQVLADWEAIVGPAIAAVTTPRKLFAGTLSIAASGPIAMELTHVSDQLIARINGHLGKVTVTRLRFTQDFSRADPTSAPARPNPRAIAAARAAVDGLPDGPVRDALERLGRAVFSAPARPDPDVALQERGNS